MSQLLANLAGRVMGVGKLPTQLQLATRRDIPEMLALYYREGWVDWTHDDLSFLFDTSAQCMFKLTLDGKLVGVSLATMTDGGILYGHSNLIDSSVRDKINYFDEALKYSDYLNQIARVQILYASRRVIRLYQSGAGFKPLVNYRRAVIRTAHDIDEPLQSLDASSSAEAWQPVFDLAQSVYHASREPLFRHFAATGASCTVLQDDGVARAFAFVRQIPKATVIGPVLAADIDGARAVVASAWLTAGRQPLVIEGADNQLETLLPGYFDFEWEENQMMKMYRGDASLLEDETRIFGVFSRYIS